MTFPDESLKDNSLEARAFIVGLTASGLSVLVYHMSGWRTEDLTRFAFLLVATILGSGLKVSLPSVTGTVSVYFLFILIGILQLTLPETLTLGVAATLMQSVWHSKNRPSWLQSVFNVANTTLSTWFAHWVYHQWAYMTEVRAGHLFLLGVASLVFFVANTGSVAVVIALTEGRGARQVWQQCYLWFFPYYLTGASLAGLFDITTRIAGWQEAMLILPMVSVVYRAYRLYLERVEVEKSHVAETASLHLRTIEALSLAIEAKDETTGNHLQRVQVYALEIAKDLGVPRDQLQALQAAAILHDIGKLAIPEHIISKPGKLTPEEFEKMKIHPVVGAEILDRVRFPYPVVPIVRAHHEKWDGSGYPFGLKGEEIPIGARILAAVDCLDALATDRQYRRALPLEEAMSIVRSEAGRSYDPKVVEVLSRRFQELEHLAKHGPMLAELAKLSRELKVAYGRAPGNGLAVAPSPPAPQSSSDFLSSIAAARQEAQSLFELIQLLGNSLSLSETLSVFAARLIRLVPFDTLAIYVVRNDRLVPEFVVGEEMRLYSTLEIPMGSGLSGWAADNSQSILNGIPSLEFSYQNDPDRYSKLQSALVVPLVGSSGVVGVLSLYRAARESFTSDQLRILQAINSKVSISVENAIKYRQVENSATTDYLTGLPNARSLFLHLDRELARCGRSGETLAVLVCDLDGFKQVNDRFGHLSGNKVLSIVAAGLKECCREYDYVARMGGDEFVVIVPGLLPQAAHHKVAEFLQVARQASRAVCGEEILSISVGEAYYPKDGKDAEQLLVEADRRMYRSKRRNKAPTTVSDPSILRADGVTVTIQ
jgi:diguanylate cyclase (GGDEF)-like protein/putative nucleotidyltransferase with HDIG domain